MLADSSKLLAGAHVRSDLPTVLIVAPSAEGVLALLSALGELGIQAHCVAPEQAQETIELVAPDLIVVANAPQNGPDLDHARQLTANGHSSVVPVILLSDQMSSDQRIRALRHGLIALVTPSDAHTTALRIAGLIEDLPDSRGTVRGVLGPESYAEIVGLVAEGLHSGILSIGRAHDPEDVHLMQMMLGPGRSREEAVHTFIEHLRPLLANNKSPLRYEFQEIAGTRLRLLSSQRKGSEEELLALERLRVLIVDGSPGRADHVAQALRSYGALVVVAGSDSSELSRVRDLDPVVVVLDAASFAAGGLTVMDALQSDLRLRWASILVTPWDEVWPSSASQPDIPWLANGLSELVQPDVALRQIVSGKAKFESRLETVGPFRIVRALTAVPQKLHVTVRARGVTVHVDLAEGLVVGATAEGDKVADERAESVAALAVLFSLGAGRVSVEHREHASVANIMLPVDEALVLAVSQADGLFRNMEMERPSRNPSRGGKLSLPSGPVLPDDSISKLHQLALDLGSKLKTPLETTTQSLLDDVPKGSAPTASDLPPPDDATLVGIEVPPVQDDVDSEPLNAPTTPAKKLDPNSRAKPKRESESSVPTAMARGSSVKAAEKSSYRKPERALPSRRRPRSEEHPPGTPLPRAAGVLPAASMRQQPPKKGESAPVPAPTPRGTHRPSNDEDSWVMDATSPDIPVTDFGLKDPKPSTESGVELPRLGETLREGQVDELGPMDRPETRPDTIALGTYLLQHPKLWPILAIAVGLVMAAVVLGIVVLLRPSPGAFPEESTSTRMRARPLLPDKMKTSSSAGSASTKASHPPKKLPSPSLVPSKTTTGQAGAIPRTADVVGEGATQQTELPDSASPDGLDTDALLERADRLRRRDKLGEAAALYERVLQEQPKNTDALRRLIRLRLSQRNGAEALRWLEVLIKLRPNQPDYQVWLGDAWSLSGNAERARAAWQKALQLNPNHRDARERLQ